MVMTGNANAATAGSVITIGVPNIPGFVPGSTDQTLVIPFTPNFGASLPPHTNPTYGWFAAQSRDMNCSGCTGDRIMFDLNLPGSQHQPLFTYSSRTFTCSNNIVNVPGSYDIGTGNSTIDGPIISGAWGSLTINVITADTNPSDAGSSPLVEIWPGWTFNTVAGTETFNPNGVSDISLLHAGTRTILPGSTSGSQAGDSLNFPGANTWVGETGTQTKSSGITNGPPAQCPVVNVTWQTTR